MELAEAAHREALRDIQPRPERRASPFPGMPDLPAPFFPRDATYGQLFAKLSRCVRQTILLEARLAAGAYDHAEPAPARTPQAAPPAPPVTPHHRPEHRPRLRPEQPEDDLAADAGRSPEDILTGICAELGAALDSGLPIPNPSQAARARTAPHKPPSDPPPSKPARLSQTDRAAHQALYPGIPPPR